MKIFVSQLYDTNQTPAPNVDLSLPIPYHEVGRILAAWVTMQTQGKANVLVIGSDEIVPTKSYVKGFTEGLVKMCGPGCKSSYVNAPVPEWSTKIQPSVQSALLADSTINYIVPIYDSMSQFVIPAVRITGKHDVGQDRHVQRNAIRDRCGSQRRCGNGHRRESRLDRPLHPRRLHAAFRRPARR